jgi:putative ABC transport system permease protein
MTSVLNTVLIVLELSCLYFPLILGSYINISLMKVPDISIESAYVCGAVFGGKMLEACAGMPSGMALMCVVLASMTGGLIVGTFSSFFTRFGMLPHLLTSILTNAVFYGINQFILSGATMSLSNSKNPLILSDFTVHSSEFLTVLGIALCLIVVGYFFLKTQLGYACAVFGNNPKFFTHYHVSTNAIFILGVVIANALAGLSGYLVAQSSGFVDVNAAQGLVLTCITALILGKVAMFYIKNFSIVVPVVGAISLCGLQQLLLRIGCSQRYFMAIQACLIISILTVKYYREGKHSLDNLGV